MLFLVHLLSKLLIHEINDTMKIKKDESDATISKKRKMIVDKIEVSMIAINHFLPIMSSSRASHAIINPIGADRSNKKIERNTLRSSI